MSITGHRNAFGATPPSCPHCQSALRRVRRKLGDRIAALFLPRELCRYRYRCLSEACGWYGCVTCERPAYGQPGARGPLLDASRSGSKPGKRG
jgi:hypothetical protein